MKIFKKTHRAENATLTETGLLLFIAQNTDATGMYQYPDSETAEAVDSTKSTVHRLRNRLLTNNYLTVRIPRKWLGEKGWSEVGVAVSRKGFKALLLNSKMGQATTLTQKTMDPDPFGSMTICNGLSVKKEFVSDTDSLNLGIIPDGSGSLIDLTVRQVLTNIEHRRMMAELAASHWGPRLLRSGDIVGLEAIDGDRIRRDLLPLCTCNKDVVTYSYQDLGNNRFQIFPKATCEGCINAEWLREREATEKEFDRLLKKGHVRFLHHGDKVPMSYCTKVKGALRLKYIKELALDRCSCSNPVFYDLDSDGITARINASDQCYTCGRLQPQTDAQAAGQRTANLPQTESGVSCSTN